MARKILLADDSVTAQNMGRKILADAGYEVVTVNNGSAALKRIAEINPDMIVLDVYMPGYSGLEVCQRLKDAAETAHMPVLLTVGKLEPFKAEEARRVKADGHIVKPFEASELLTAITRLEDRILLQQSASAKGDDANARKMETAAEADTGWKSRLRFSSKKKKEASEHEVAPNFREFRKVKAKAGANGAAKAPQVQEPTLAKTQPKEKAPVPEVLRDITPEELDTLSALAAQLNDSTRADEKVTPPAQAATTEAEVPVAAMEAYPESRMANPVVASVAEPDVESSIASTLEPVLESTSVSAVAPVITPIIERPDAEVASPALAAETQAFHVVGQSAVEIPVEHLEPAATVVMEVNAAALVQPPAPVDSHDEPMFASAVGAFDPSAQVSDQANTDAVALSNMIETTPAEAPSQPVAESRPESPSEESNLQPSNLAGLQSEDAVPPAPVPETMESEAPPPSDAELAEALRLLTPAAGQDGSTIPSHTNLVEAGQLLSAAAARHASGATRWVAEPVAMNPEEAGVSLEAEMFRAFAVMPATTMPATMPLSSVETSASETDTARSAEASAIAAAVERRLAAAEIAANQSGPAAAESGNGAVEGQVLKAMAAAATAEGSSAECSSASAPDATTIASIVESVMADLRPRIVEEITRKLAGK